MNKLIEEGKVRTQSIIGLISRIFEINPVKFEFVLTRKYDSIEKLFER
ncbi:MAG TPA: hypothetical protein VL854_00850 [Nitrososphaeraceae archaeon]|nr:hypothetical protein [Nitrososphaeraceae archaeon]